MQCRARPPRHLREGRTSVVERLVGSFSYLHFINEIFRTSISVNDEEDVANVGIDAALQGWIEAEVGRKALDIAVEG